VPLPELSAATSPTRSTRTNKVRAGAKGRSSEINRTDDALVSLSNPLAEIRHLALEPEALGEQSPAYGDAVCFEFVHAWPQALDGGAELAVYASQGIN
jgi:hypothetical protein